MNPFTTKNDPLVAAAAEILESVMLPRDASKWSDAQVLNVLKTANSKSSTLYLSAKSEAKKRDLLESADDLDEAKFKFNPKKHEVQVSDKRSGGKFSITVVDKETNSKVLHRMSHELPMADEGGNEYTAGARIRDAKRVLGEDVDLDEAINTHLKKQNYTASYEKTKAGSYVAIVKNATGKKEFESGVAWKTSGDAVGAANAWANARYVRASHDELQNVVLQYKPKAQVSAIGEDVDLDEANIKVPQKFVDHAREVGSTVLFAELTYRNWQPRGLTDKQILDKITAHGEKQKAEKDK